VEVLFDEINTDIGGGAIIFVKIQLSTFAKAFVIVSGCPMTLSRISVPPIDEGWNV
jgi:hypothetical protein